MNYYTLYFPCVLSVPRTKGKLHFSISRFALTMECILEERNKVKKEIVKIIYRCGKIKEERAEGRERGGGEQKAEWTME